MPTAYSGITAAVVGLGYVGLPLALEMVAAGHKVIGIDVDQAKVESLKSGASYVLDVKSADVREAVSSGRLLPTSDFGLLAAADVISLCVPTPLTKTKDPDMSYIIAAASEVAKYLRAGQLVVLESTTYPGTTEEVILPMLAERGGQVGVDFYLAFSPERVDPGNKKFSTRNTPKVVGGVTKACAERAVGFYATFLDTIVPVSSAKAAEMVKLVENTFRAVNIAMVNEMAQLCDRMGIDVWDVLAACATKPFGYMPFYPGPGIGGHCIPLDPHYLAWKARTFEFSHHFIELASEINGGMPRFVVAKIGELLNDCGKAVRGSRILLMGLTYKRDINDLRESPALEVFGQLKGMGAAVACSDPHVGSFVDSSGGTHVTVPLTPEEVRAADLVVLLTDHTAFDYSMVAEEARLIYDTRNAFKSIRSPRIVRLGSGTLSAVGALALAGERAR